MTTEKIYHSDDSDDNYDQGDIRPIGTLCHEIGHILGLPDLYDTSESSAPGIGDWGLMGTGNWNNQVSPSSFSAWSSSRLGITEIEELLAAVASNVDPVSASVKFLAERSDEFALAIEHDHGVLRVGGHRAVFDIDQPRSVDGDSVRILPTNVRGDLHAIVMHLVPMAFRTNHRRLQTALVFCSENRRGRTGEGHASGCLQKSAT